MIVLESENQTTAERTTQDAQVRSLDAAWPHPSPRMAPFKIFEYDITSTMFIPLIIALSQPVNIAQTQPCKLSAIGDKETNNCPLSMGIFASKEWTIKLSYWEPGAYILKGINRVNGKKIEATGDEVWIQFIDQVVRVVDDKVGV